MSTRQSREDLIKKGVLKEVYEKGERHTTWYKFTNVVIDMLIVVYYITIKNI